MQADRPLLPSSYGLATGPGPLDWNDARQRLEQARNYWICSCRPSGRPHAVPVWAVWLEDSLCFGTEANSAKARNLVANPACSVHLESGDDALILDADARALAGDRLERADQLYRAKYGLGMRDAPGQLSFFQIVPFQAMAWREHDFPSSATRWKLA